MSLYELSRDATTTKIFVKQEFGSEEDSSSSTELARTLGLLDTPKKKPGREDAKCEDEEVEMGAYRVLGFSPDKLWCSSTKIVALPVSEVYEYGEILNCGKVSCIDLPRGTHLPFVSLDYFDSLLSFSETEDGELVILDEPTLDARVEEIWWDGLQYHARVWMEGSFKGKHKSTTVEFTYNPLANEICAHFDSVKNDYIRVSDIQICWRISNGLICASATVTWRPKPEWTAHITVCMALAAKSRSVAIDSNQLPIEGHKSNCGCN